MSDPIFEAVSRTGACARYLFRILRAIPGALKRPGLTTNQIWFIGAKSLVIIMIAGFFIGMVLALQGVDSLSIFGAQDRTGAIVAVAVLRELGPVVTALLFAGRAGTSMAAEIGLMRATEQFDALDAMAIDSDSRVIAPRFLAGIISMPLLVGIFCMMAIMGAYFVGVKLMGIDEGLFWTNIQSAIRLEHDLLQGFAKSVVFGGIVSLIAVYEGAVAPPTGAGVAQATTQTVVFTAIVILAVDFVLTALLI